MSLSYVQTSAMAVEMGIAAPMSTSGSDDCHGCDDGDLDGADLSSCLAVCGAAVQGLPPAQSADLPQASQSDLYTVDPVFSGRTNTPDHGPPKLLTLG
jgi:hypothetical protein